MMLTALNALIIGCSVGGGLILVALIIAIIFVCVYFRVCCKKEKGSKYASNLTANNPVENSLEKKYSSQSGLPPTGLGGLWTKVPSMQTGPAPGPSAFSAFYKPDNTKDSFVRNIDKRRPIPNSKDQAIHDKSLYDIHTNAASASSFAWPSIDDVNSTSNNNSYGSQAKLIVTDLNRGLNVADVSRPKKLKSDPKPSEPLPKPSEPLPNDGKKMNVEAIIENSSRPFNGKMTIPTYEKQLIGDAFKFLDDLE